MEKMRTFSSISMFLFLQVIFPYYVVYPSVLDGLVSTPWGKIRGIPKTSSYGHSFTSFEGIPYAKPPLGDLRFSKPVPSTGSNSSIHIADVVRPSCLVANASTESEDCLYLDLYVPHGRDVNFPSSPLSVMVYIHGGGFISYSGDLNPERLLERGVIVALVHYRLGAIGFLSSGDEVLKGNYGLWDQQLAIRWVKDNVAAFGGDPNSMTVFGESAGSASVAYQILSPTSKGLFKRAILQSGTASSSWALSRQPAKFAYSLGARVGCASSLTSLDLAKCLRKVDGAHLHKEMFLLRTTFPTFQHIADFMFVPAVDHEFVMDEPLDLIKNTTYLATVGAFEKDVIIGVLNDEASLVTLSTESAMPNAPKFGDFFAKDIVPFLLYQRYGVSNSETEGIAESFYRQNIPYTLLNKFQVSNLFADAQFVIPALEFMAALSNTTTKVGHRYFYYLDYCPSFAPAICMAHGVDVGFVFQFGINFTSADQRVSDIFVNLLTTFAQTGIPKSANTPNWREFSADSNSYLRISTQPEVKEKLFPRRFLLWTETIPLLLAKPIIVHAPIIG